MFLAVVAGANNICEARAPLLGFVVNRFMDPDAVRTVTNNEVPADTTALSGLGVGSWETCDGLWRADF